MVKNFDVFGANNSDMENLYLLKVVPARSITSNSGLSSCLPLLYVGSGFRVFVEQLFTELACGAELHWLSFDFLLSLLCILMHKLSADFLEEHQILEV